MRQNAATTHVPIGLYSALQIVQGGGGETKNSYICSGLGTNYSVHHLWCDRFIYIFRDHPAIAKGTHVPIGLYIALQIVQGGLETTNSSMWWPRRPVDSL